MKKVLLFLSALLLLVISGSSFASTSSVDAIPSDSSMTSVSGDYSYVGDFYFKTLDGRLGHTVKVYEASNACGQYYAYDEGTYYKMFSCNESGYNYYYAKGYNKYYTKI